MRILLTGADGYIGVVMGPKLIAAGHDVTGLDTGFYRRGWLFDDRADPSQGRLQGPARGSTVEDLEGFDAVVHLSELSNDPIGENDPEPHHGDQPQGLGRPRPTRRGRRG